MHRGVKKDCLKSRNKLQFFYALCSYISCKCASTIHCLHSNTQSYILVRYCFTKQKDGYSLPTNSLTNNHISWIWMSKKIGLYKVIAECRANIEYLSEALRLRQIDQMVLWIFVSFHNIRKMICHRIQMQTFH